MAAKIPSVPGSAADNFLGRCLRGEVTSAAVTDEIIRWNAGDRRVPIHTFLGLTDAEWALYVEAEGHLERILQERRTRHLHRPQPVPAMRGRRF